MNKRDARAPHTATAIVVEALGEAEARHLYARFSEYNARFFNGELAQALILITQSGSARTLGDYCPRDVHGLESRIRIAPATIKRGLLYAEDVLLHEMIHAWQHEVHGDLEDGYRGHGPVFAEKANEIGAQLGLPRVSPKGRTPGEPPCAQWPANVRPEGYYGEHYQPPAKRRPARERDEDEREEDEREEDDGDELLHARMVAAVARQLAHMTDETLHALAAAVARENLRRAGGAQPAAAPKRRAREVADLPAVLPGQLGLPGTKTADVPRCTHPRSEATQTARVRHCLDCGAVFRNALDGLAARVAGGMECPACSAEGPHTPSPTGREFCCGRCGEQWSGDEDMTEVLTEAVKRRGKLARLG